MFAHILFEFGGKPTNRQLYTFELPPEVGFLKAGQLVVVEGKEPGEKILGIFVRAFHTDYEAIKYPEKYPTRKKVIKKAHKNSLIALVKKRYQLFQDIHITKGSYKAYQTAFKNNAHLDKQTIRKNLLRNLIVAAEVVGKRKGARRAFRFGNMQIMMRDNTIVDVVALEPKKVAWVKPEELFQIAHDYVEKMESELLEKEKQV